MSATEPVRPPQQARSRAAMQRLLASAEYVLINGGPDEFTIARVAEHAGVSVGGVYRRFAGKEQLIDAVRRELLDRLETTITAALDAASPSVSGVLDALTSALGDILAVSGLVIPAMVAGPRSADAPQQGADALDAIRARFVAAMAPHRDQIRHPDPDTALDIAFRSVVATGAHRAATSPWWPDGRTWRQWANEITAMTTAYLTA